MSEPTTDAQSAETADVRGGLIGRRVTFERVNLNYSRTLLQRVTDVVEWETREGNGWYFRLSSFGHFGMDVRTDRIVSIDSLEVAECPL